VDLELRWHPRRISLCLSEREKKAAGESAIVRPDDAADSLEAFHQRLRDLCEDHRECHGPERAGRIRAQAEQALALARELGVLKEPDFTWEEFRTLSSEFRIGTEHMVELDARSGMVGKTTLPPAFGLIPEVVNLPLAEVRPDADRKGFRQAIEFLNATPLEYLVRWIACNEVFGDQVKLAAVIRWTDGLVSFGITQPQYHGTPADPREIEGLFLKAGWSRLADPSGHTVFFNHAFGVLAIDAERRNCFVNDGGLQPFDVILCKPDETMERFLGIYPE